MNRQKVKTNKQTASHLEVGGRNSSSGIPAEIVYIIYISEIYTYNSNLIFVWQVRGGIDRQIVRQIDRKINR